MVSYLSVSTLIQLWLAPLLFFLGYLHSLPSGYALSVFSLWTAVKNTALLAAALPALYYFLEYLWSFKSQKVDCLNVQ